MESITQQHSLSRRTVLKLAGTTLVGASLGTGTVAANGYRPDDWEDVSWGKEISMGKGDVRTYVNHGEDGAPDEVGLYFTAGALDGLPSLGEEPHAHFALELPADADATPFGWVGVDWAAEGHPPPEIYGVPHLDVHFYMMDQDAVHAIPPDDDYQVPLAEDQHPPGYVRTHEVVPAMGDHLINSSAPEFHGEPFTHTFVWGAYDGNLTFYEPMITIDYLKGLTGTTRSAIDVPEAFAEAGNYPTGYAVQYHPDQDAYTVSLDCFQSFEASNGVEEPVPDESVSEFEYMFRVEDMAGEPIDGATVEVDGEMGSTSEMGTVTFVLPEGEYDATANAEGYDSTTQMVIVEGEQMQTMPLVLEAE